MHLSSNWSWVTTNEYAYIDMKRSRADTHTLTYFCIYLTLF